MYCEALAHSSSQEDVYQALPLAKGKAAAFEYVGKVPDGSAFILD
jgi:hypothetical protein